MLTVVAVVLLAFHSSAPAQTPILAAGSYGAGTYKLANSIRTGINATGAYTGAIAFTGAATLDLNCKELANIAGSGNGRAILSVGVMSDYAVTIFDSCGTGRIKGYRVGAKLSGARSQLIGVDLSENLYIGAWLQGAGSKAIRVRIASIGGVSDEPYATGVLVNANSIEIAGGTFLEFYRQAGYGGASAGEGVAINLASGSNGAFVHHNYIANSAARTNTYAVFAGGDDNRVNDNFARNFWRAFAINCETGKPEVLRNYAVIESALANSRGVGCETVAAGVAEHNVAIGYAMAFFGRTPTALNVALTFPGFR
jgi:hypothetical protein